MIQEELYHRTVDILVKAYVDGTLLARSCYACACGNLIAASMGLKYVPDPSECNKGGLAWDSGYPVWQNIVYTDDTGYQHIQVLNLRDYPPAELQIKSTGYHLIDFAKIEHAFETNHKGDDPQYNGLMAVIDVLDEIHEVQDSKVTTDSKAKFVKA